MEFPYLTVQQDKQKRTAAAPPKTLRGPDIKNGARELVCVQNTWGSFFSSDLTAPKVSFVFT